VVVATFVMNFVSLGTFYSAADFVIPLEDTFIGSGRGAITFLPTIYLSVALFSSLGAGLIQDILQKHGMSVAPVFTVGGLCIGVGTVGSSYGNSLGMVLLCAIITGIGIGWTGFTAAGVCVMWFDKNRGTMLLLAMAGAGVGDFFYSILVQKLLNVFTEKEGCSEDETSCEAWRPVMRVAGVISMVLAVASASFLRLPEPGEVEKHEEDHDEMDDDEIDSFLEKHYGSVGQTVIPEMDEGTELIQKQEGHHFTGGRRSSVATLGSAFRSRYNQTHHGTRSARFSEIVSRNSVVGNHASIRSRRSSSIAEFEALGMLPVRLSTLPDSTVEAPTAGLPYLSLSEVLNTKTTIALLLWTVLCAFVYTNFYVHLVAYAESVGMTADAGARALSLTGVGMLVGNITLGRVTDAVGPLAILKFTMMALTVFFFMWPYCVTSESLSCVALLFGYMASTQCSVPLIILADAFGETSPDSILTLLGILHVCKFPGYLLGPSFIGSVYERFGNYHIASVISGVGMLAGNLFLFMIPSTEEQNKMVMERHEKKLQNASNS